MSSIHQITSAHLTDTGQVRDHNEDFVVTCEPQTDQEAQLNGWVYLVADGVGGADAGEVASSYACERAIYHYLKDSTDQPINIRLETAIHNAHTDLCTLIEQRNDDRRMGTTLVAAALAENEAILANVGDSRGYHVRKGEIRQVTKDHSLIAKLLDEGIVSEAEAATLNIGNIILQSIGSEQPPQVDLFTVSLEDNDQLLLCSDGLTNHVADDELAEIVTNHSPDVASRKLVDLANARGGYDNITVLVVKYRSNGHVAS